MRNVVHKKARIYLDYAAGTPADPGALKAMRPYEGEMFGNPSSLHIFGQEASRAVFGARRKVADLLGVSYKEILFTASATEANNLALEGVVEEARVGSVGKGIKKPRVIVLETEHESVLEPARHLATFGVEVVSIPVNREGMLDVKKLEKALTKETVLVSIGYVNSETGAIQPISEIAKIIEKFRSTINPSEKWPYPLFHTDAVQALPYINIVGGSAGVDLATISSHKIYGPKGAAALYIKEGREKLLSARIRGGDQEMKLRSGTENVPGIVGFGEATEILKKRREKDAVRIGRLRDKFFKGVASFWKGAELNGPAFGKNRVPGNANVFFPGISAGELLTRLDLMGVSASAGSACASRVPEPSHVLLAMGFSKERAMGSVRFTLGRKTSEKEIAKTLKILKSIYSKIR